MHISDFSRSFQQVTSEVKTTVTEGTEKLLGKVFSKGSSIASHIDLPRPPPLSEALHIINPGQIKPQLSSFLEKLSQKISNLFDKIINKKENNTINNDFYNEIKPNNVIDSHINHVPNSNHVPNNNSNHVPNNTPINPGQMQADYRQQQILNQLGRPKPGSNDIKTFAKAMFNMQSVFNTWETNKQNRSELFAKFGAQILNPRALLGCVGSDSSLRTAFTKFISTGLAHEWGLSGKVQIGGNEHNIEGSYSDLNHIRLGASFEKYCESKSKASSALSSNVQKNVQTCLQNAPLYMNHNRSASDALKDYQKGLPITLGTGWDGHAVEITLHNGYLIYTNRGEQSRGEVSGNLPGNMMMYKINGPVTQEFIKKILDDNNKKSPENKGSMMKYIEGKGPGTMQEQLGLELVHVVEKESQKVGNCSWANTKGALFSSMTLSLMKDIKTQNSQLSEKEVISMALKQAKDIYKDWEASSRHGELNSFLDLKNEVLTGNVDLSPQDFFKMVSFAGTKIAVKQSYQQENLSGRAEQMKADIKAKLTDFPLQHCFQQVSNPESFTDVLNMARPGAFLLRNPTTPGTPPNVRELSYKAPDGTILHQTLTLNNDGSFEHVNPQGQKTTMRTLGDLMRTFPEISTPVSVEGAYAPIVKHNKETLENFKSFTRDDKNGVSELLAKYQTGIVGIYKSSNGNIVLNQRLPKFASSFSNQTLAQQECSPNNYLGTAIHDFKSPATAFKALQNLKLAYDNHQEALASLRSDNNKTMVVYKDSKGDYYAIRKQTGTDQVYPPQKMDVSHDINLFGKLEEYDSQMHLQEVRAPKIAEITTSQYTAKDLSGNLHLTSTAQSNHFWANWPKNSPLITLNGTSNEYDINVKIGNLIQNAPLIISEKGFSTSLLKTNMTYPTIVDLANALKLQNQQAVQNNPFIKATPGQNGTVQQFSYPPNLTTTQTALKNDPLNHGPMTSNQANSLVKDQPPGTGVLRFSNNPTENDFVLTIKSASGQIQHLQANGRTLEQLLQEIRKNPFIKINLLTPALEAK